MDTSECSTSTPSTEAALTTAASDDDTAVGAGQADDVTQRRCEKYNLRRCSARVRVQAERRVQERLQNPHHPHPHRQQQQQQQTQEKAVDDDEEEEEEEEDDDDDDVMDRRGARKAARRGGRSREDAGSNQRKPKSRPPPLSKYRRRSANARERCRMAEINDAFEDLKAVLPQHGLETASTGGSEGSGSEDGQQSLGSTAGACSSGRGGRGKGAARGGGGGGGGGSGGRGGSKHQPTKITVLRLAINYIAALREMLGYNADGSGMIGELPDIDSVVSDSPNEAGIQQGLLALSSFCETLAEAPGNATLSIEDDRTQDFHMVDEGAMRVSPGADPEKGGAKEVAFAAQCDRLTGPGMVPKVKKTKRTRRKTLVRGGRRSRATPARIKAQTSQAASDGAGVVTHVNGPQEESVPCSHVSEVIGGSGVFCKTVDSLVTATADRLSCVEDDLLSSLLLLRGSSDSLDFHVPCKDGVLAAATVPGGYPDFRGDLHLPVDVLLPFRTDDLGSDAASTTTTTTTATPTASCSSGDDESLLSSPTSDIETVVTELDFFTAGFSAADFSPDLSPDFTATLSPEDMCFELVASVF